jgi:hypothetical protein
MKKLKQLIAYILGYKEIISSELSVDSDNRDVISLEYTYGKPEKYVSTDSVHWYNIDGSGRCSDKLEGELFEIYVKKNLSK